MSSSAPVKAVISGAAVASLSIDYFALAKLGDLGPTNLGFQLPLDQTVVNVDPIVMLKGAPNLKAAGRFIEFLLSAATQKLFVLPKGVKEGPLFSTLGRLAVNTKTYDETEGLRVTPLNPFRLQMPSFVLDREHATKMQFVLADLIGAVLIDAHAELKSTVRYLRKTQRMGEFKKIVFPITEEDVHKLALIWSDQSVRNRTINSWLTHARSLYSSVRKVPR